MSEDHPHYGPHCDPHPQPGDTPSSHCPEAPPSKERPEFPPTGPPVTVSGVTFRFPAGRIEEDPIEISARVTGRTPAETLARVQELVSRYNGPSIRPPGCAQREPRAEDDATRPLASDLARPSTLTLQDARQIRRDLEEVSAAAARLWATLEEWRLQPAGMDAAEAAHHRHKMGEAVARAVGRIETICGFALGTMDAAAVRRA